jgi:hypothetical protein
MKGTTMNVFRDFCELVCGNIKRDGIDKTDDHRIFIWDNLRTHHIIMTMTLNIM